MHPLTIRLHHDDVQSDQRFVLDDAAVALHFARSERGRNQRKGIVASECVDDARILQCHWQEEDHSTGFDYIRER